MTRTRSSREPTPARGITLFWRTFIYMALMLLACIVAWLQTYRALEFEPRAIQSARQVASLVNLSRAALVHADPIARISLVKTLGEEEDVRIAVRERQDSYEPYDQDALGRRISAELLSNLGKGTIVARKVNGEEGLWVGFTIGQENFWLLTDPNRVGAVERTTWLVWLGIAVALSLLGAALMARLINLPLKRLQVAAHHVREGNFQASHLDEEVPTREIREVNIGFNRMAEQLGQAEQDRALMLAGISHDLRTPLARLRLETEMSVADPTAREHMAADIDQVNAIIDKFLDYARAENLVPERVSLNTAVDQAVKALAGARELRVKVNIPPLTAVYGDAVELQRVFANLLENAMRYGRGADGIADVEIAAKAQAPWILVKVKDHGKGVDPALLPRLTQPFFRGDSARTAATGSGLGLAIVNKTVSRMGGRLTLANSSSGGLAAHIKLPQA
jgi:two-component system, OmpR family, osmolarity sensor histidine kinase EnvZ